MTKPEYAPVPSTRSPLLALDIGGANIKLADGNGFATNWPFPLWKHPDRLADKLAQCLANAPTADRLVVTMTGELCDCFETKSQGVAAIVSATMKAAVKRSVSFYQTNGRFVNSAEAIQSPLLTAASNWHALASAATYYGENDPGILIDVGSTTMDLIPLVEGSVAALGRTDTERLLSGELVYSGVERSPVCSVISELPWTGKSCPVAQELFATTADVYLLLGNLPEDSADTNTADGKPFTVEASHTRLARMVCGDRELVSFDDAVKFAQAIRDAQLRKMRAAFQSVVHAMPSQPQTIILSGHGEFLARLLMGELEISASIVSLNDEWGAKLNRCAPAHALALLAQESLS